MSHALDNTSRFAELFARIKAKAASSDRHRELPHEEVRELAELGFGALRVPSALGGGGLTVAELSEHLLALAAADSNYPQILRAHFIFVESLLFAKPSPTRDLWLKRIVNGAIVGGAHTERNSTNSEHFATKVQRDDEGLWLTGEKYYSTGSLYADWVATLAEGENDQLVLLAVAKATPGLITEDDWSGFGQRLTASGTTRFEKVAINEADSVPSFEGLAPYGTSLAQHFHLIGLAGIAHSAHEAAVAYVRERKRYFSQGSRALPKDDAIIQSVIGELSSAAYTSAVIVRDIAWRLDTLLGLIAQPEPDIPRIDDLEQDVFRAQHTVVSTVLEAATRLFDIGGASALDAERNWDRFWRNARTLSSHNPIGFRLKAIGDYELNGQVAFRQWFSGVDLSLRAAK
ncbi:acyl-CoA dehydrogenase family protein [Pseudomonas sp. LRF_L74]|uniref:acyl-CoA dehydrogenase family protein n=1 Tax=Pseudomonas sp. LRF_L74 TaxID=3369422 RepID=UPI003F621C55